MRQRQRQYKFRYICDAVEPTKLHYLPMKSSCRLSINPSDGCKPLIYLLLTVILRARAPQQRLHFDKSTGAYGPSSPFIVAPTNSAVNSVHLVSWKPTISIVLLQIQVHMSKATKMKRNIDGACYNDNVHPTMIKGPPRTYCSFLGEG